MTRTNFSARKLLRTAFEDFRVCWKSVAGYMAWFAILSVVVLSPVTAWLLDRIVGGSGQVAISNHDLASFALSARGAIFLLVAATMYIVALQLQVGGLTLLAIQAAHRQPVSLWRAIRESATRLPAFLKLSAILAGVAVALIGLLAATLLVIKLSLLGGHDINFYLSERPPEWRRAVVLGGIVSALTGLVLLWVFTRWIYAIPRLLMNRLSAPAALRESWQLTRTHWKRLAGLMILWWAGTSVVWMSAAWIGRLLAHPLFNWAGFYPAKVLLVIALCLVITGLSAWLWSVVTLTIHQFAITRLALDNIQQSHPVAPLTAARSSSHLLTSTAWVGLLGLAVASALTGWALLTNLELVETVEITAHRGSSAKAPENTLAAIRLAIEHGADYAEIDVQTCADGTVVVIHDRDLMRMGGNPGRVENLNLRELQEIDIGQRFAEEFTGEHVPTLKEVIDVARGHIKLNVELKYNRPDPKLIPAVLQLMKTEQFLDQCVITSLDAAAVIQFKEAEPRMQTGLIVTAAIGRVTQVQADFLSVAAAQATPTYIRQSHRADKPVHVWTVNDPMAMLQMIEAGADNIITDKPDVLQTVLHERAQLSDPEKIALRLRVLFGGGVPITTSGDSLQ